jgi:glycosyltransferase involved in cell wall biosynthesis
MRVLHLSAGNLYGGIETYLVTLARCRDLVPDMDPHFGTCFPGRLRDELIATGAPVHDLGRVRFSRPWTVLRARWRLRRLLRATAFDVVVAHGCWLHAIFGPPVRRAGVRLGYAVHGIVSRDSWLSRWAARTRPDVVIANSRFTARSAAKLFPHSSVEVVYLPVSAPQLASRHDIRNEVRAEIGTPADVVVILQASRLEPWKGHRLHLDALARLRDIARWEAWLVGGPQRPVEALYLNELKIQAEQLGIAGRVRFLGQRSDVPRLMAAADMYCQPNTGPEPFGIAFVEALHANLPVVTSAFGGAQEIMDDACGVLPPAGDVAALASALRDLLNDPERRRRLGAAGPERARRLCEPARQLAVLREVLAGTSRSHPIAHAALQESLA